jgi:hypothetical protein
MFLSDQTPRGLLTSAPAEPSAESLKAELGTKNREDVSVTTGRDNAVEIRRVKCVLTESLFKRVLRKVFPDQRQHDRVSVPTLVGYLGTARSSEPYAVADISLSGFCLLTNERWSPGTEMPVTLLNNSEIGEDDPECFTVQATVVRCGKDGVGFTVLLSEDESQAAYGNPLRVKWASKPEMERFLRRLSGQPVPEVTPSEEPKDSAQAQTVDGTQSVPKAPLKTVLVSGR